MMLTMSFDYFYNGDFDEDDARLYVVRNKTEFIYIGISNSNIWNRWFVHRMGRDNDGWFSKTGDAISIKIISNMPDSLSWKIDLWTLEECNEYLQMSRSDIKSVEPFFIGGLKPLCNYTYFDFDPQYIPNGGYKNSYFEFTKLFKSFEIESERMNDEKH